MNKNLYVYIIEAEYGVAGSYFKIGISNNPQSRLASHQTSSPVKLILCSTLKHAKAPNIESKLHALLRPFNTSGEWFRFPYNTSCYNIFLRKTIFSDQYSSDFIYKAIIKSKDYAALYSSFNPKTKNESVQHNTEYGIDYINQIESEFNSWIIKKSIGRYTDE